MVDASKLTESQLGRADRRDRRISAQNSMYTTYRVLICFTRVQGAHNMWGREMISSQSETRARRNSTIVIITMYHRTQLCSEVNLSNFINPLCKRGRQDNEIGIAGVLKCRDVGG